VRLDLSAEPSYVVELELVWLMLRKLQNPSFKVKSLGFGPGMKGAPISGWEATLTLDRRDFDIAADQGMIGNPVDVVINVEADLQKPTPAKP